MTNTTKSGWAALEAQLNDIPKPVATFALCRDHEVRDRYLEARQADDQARDQLKSLPARGVDPDVRALVQKEAKDAAAELAAAKAEYDAHTVVLRFTALDRQDLERLQRAHPATEEDEATGAEYAMATFAPALISAASLDGMPLEAATRYMNTWPPADAADLWRAAWYIQQRKRTDLGKG